MSNNTDSIDAALNEYIDLISGLAALRKQVKEKKTQADALEKHIKEFMVKNKMDSIALKEGEIVIYSKKISQTFKKETIVEKLTEELKDSHKAEILTESILKNKKFIVEDKVKAVLKKK